MTNVSRRKFLELAGIGAGVGAGIPKLAGAGPLSGAHAAVADIAADDRVVRLAGDGLGLTAA
jgi:hypothetical protein